MGPEDPRHDRAADGVDDIAGSILDGRHVDWNRVDTEPGLDAVTVRALRDLERITEFSRELQETQLAPKGSNPLPASETERWGDLTLLELIGTGARGEVWRAWDPTLQRDVALKFLQPSVQAAGRDARAALLDEARALARVRHPGVVTVYGIAEHGGRVGMWMEYLRGATLAQEIERRGALSAHEVARIGSEISAALRVVHSAGLVHRDIKPANILVESDGRVVLADFGLGMRPELIDRTVARSSGTPIFMSPEVLAGNQATPQSDLYALGVTLLWALIGRPPFQARTLDELKKEVERRPLSAVQSVRRTAPRGLVDAIESAIDPSPAARPRSASDLAARLRTVLEETGADERRRHRSRAVLVTVAFGVVAIAFALIAIRAWLNRPPPSIAVLPLANLSGDPSQEYVTDGMTEELIARFAQIGDLRVISRSSVMHFKNSNEPLPEVAKKLHVRMVVEGTVSRVRDRLRISARLVDAGSGRAVWSGMYEDDWNNVLALESNVAKAVVGHVRARVTPRERARLEHAPEVNPEAYRLHLQGLAAYRLLTPDGIRRALISFGQATEIDPTYADPWVGLSYAYDFAVAVGLLSARESSEQSLAAARRAVALDPESGPARAALATTQLDHEWNFKAAEQGYRKALALSPGNSDARAEFVTLLCMIGRFDEAIREAKRARDDDPVSLAAGAVSMFPLYEAKRYDECIRVGRDLLALHPDASWVLLVMGQAQFLAGRHEEGIGTIEKSIAMDRIPPGIGWLGYAYGRTGNAQRARAILAELKQMQRKTYIDPYYLGITHLGLGEKSPALDYIERAGFSHSPEAKLLRVDPVLDPLRKEPRFRVLLKRLGMQG